jgi:predicted helicase
MSLFPLKPTHKPVLAYYAALQQFQLHGHTTEGNTRSAFADLLKKCASPYDWHLVEEYQFKGTGKQPLRADGALVDELTLVHGLWEAKDTAADLQREIKSKVAAGYPLTNILFQSPSRAVLYQDNRIALDCDLAKPDSLIEILKLFFEHRQAHEVDWEEAVTKFAEKIPDLANGVTGILEKEYAKNPAYRENFQSFAELCRQSINPDLADDAIRKMLVQHLLTERIFRKVFNNQEFLSRNVIAAEIEKVIRSITARHFSRDEFLKPLDRFYTAIEKAAESQQGYTEKQHFLNAVYEKFFQRFDTKQADTHGIVYTPQPIVDFMVRSVEEILQQEFGKSLSDSGVHILDPFTGTGNFITRIMQQIKRSALPHKYALELHCNEIMLLPYYIASMNIEHAYMERAGEYKPFEGICLVDTFELAESKQIGLFAAENTARVQRQKKSPIRVIIGNPPYNVGQAFENDNNKNRKYSVLDRRISETYAKSSAASSVSKLGDAYVRAIRWATDRLGEEGIIAYVSNDSFIDQIAHDGMRNHLAREFQSIYLLDLGGNTRKYPKFSGSSHNVFGIQVGVSISLFIRRKDKTGPFSLRHIELPPDMRREKRLAFLEKSKSLSDVIWNELKPDSRHTWLTEHLAQEYPSYMPLAAKQDSLKNTEEAIFRRHSLGFNTARDAWCYSFSVQTLQHSVRSLIASYNTEVRRWTESGRPKNLDAFVRNDDSQISWSEGLKINLRRGRIASFSEDHVRPSIYRPYSSMHSYFDKVIDERLYGMPHVFPSVQTENYAFCATGVGAERPFAALASSIVPNLNFFGPGTVPMWYSFYEYDEDGTNRRENITDWALAKFRTHYADDTITKWDIFHATYALLHHPEYRTRYAANLKRELPRIPFPPDLHAFTTAGKRLMELHIDYEQQPEYPLEQIEDPKAQLSFRVERMKLSKDKSELRYNDFLTLRGIPAAAFDYRLGNRSALEWVIDQYQVSTDKRSGITNDPNRPDDPQYILRLIGQVITVSLETQQIIGRLPSLNLG